MRAEVVFPVVASVTNRASLRFTEAPEELRRDDCHEGSEPLVLSMVFTDQAPHARFSYVTMLEPVTARGPQTFFRLATPVIPDRSYRTVLAGDNEAH